MVNEFIFSQRTVRQWNRLSWDIVKCEVMLISKYKTLLHLLLKLLLCSMKDFCDIIPSFTQMLRINCFHFSPGPLQKPDNLFVSGHTHASPVSFLYTIISTLYFKTTKLPFKNLSKIPCCTWDRQIDYHVSQNSFLSSPQALPHTTFLHSLAFSHFLAHTMLCLPLSLLTCCFLFLKHFSLLNIQHI